MLTVYFFSMSDTKHTPGPWTVRDHGKDMNSESNIYVHVGGEKNYGNPILKVVMGGHGALNSDNDSLIANAKLIAAAPDLLEAIQCALNIKDLWSAQQHGTISADHEGEMQALNEMQIKLEAAIKKITT